MAGADQSRRHVFLSYSRQDAEFMRRLRDDLQDAGFPIWTDEHLAPGTPDWKKAIEAAIDGAMALVVILSPDAKQSHWVAAELDYAADQQSPIIPILYRGDRKTAVPIVLATAQYVDMRRSSDHHDYKRSLRVLIARLQDMVRPVGQDDPGDTSSRIDRSKNQSHDIPPELTCLWAVAQNPQCYWADPWRLETKIDEVHLNYIDARTSKPYPDRMSRDVRRVLNHWRQEHQQEFIRLANEPLGVQVRLDGVQEDFRQFHHFLTISPTRYLYFVAVQSELGHSALKSREGRVLLRSLRRQFFDRANEEKQFSDRLDPIGLPNNFAVNLCVVSSDGHILMHQRIHRTRVFPDAWEAGIGELMHGPVPFEVPESPGGPVKRNFPAFTEDGSPDLYLFLKNAIAEELGYHGAKPDHFRLYGFAVEYEMLVPRLLGGYFSDLPIHELMDYAQKGASDPFGSLRSIELTPQGVATFCENHDLWSPNFKLLMLLTLQHDYIMKGDHRLGQGMDELLRPFKPTILVDPLISPDP